MVHRHGKNMKPEIHRIWFSRAKVCQALVKPCSGVKCVLAGRMSDKNTTEVRYFITSFTVLGCQFDQDLSDPLPTLFSCSIVFNFIFT